MSPHIHLRALPTDPWTRKHTEARVAVLGSRLRQRGLSGERARNDAGELGGQSSCRERTSWSRLVERLDGGGDCGYGKFAARCMGPPYAA